MIRYHLVDRVACASTPYRGVDRLPPLWRDDVPIDPEHDALCSELAEQGDFVRDRVVALDLARRFGTIRVDVEVIASDTKLGGYDRGDILLGYDVTWFSYHSFLADGPEQLLRPFVSSKPTVVLSIVADLFAPRLNANWLFSRPDDALRFREDIRAAKALDQALFENDIGFAPQAYAIYEVSR